MSYANHGQDVLDTETRALAALAEWLRGEGKVDFDAACELISTVDTHTPGRIVVTGMGKSGHIGHKIAATLASTGTPAFFVHPGEAQHGDLGMITPQDVVIALSNSGTTPEVVAIVPIIKRMGVKLLAITGAPDSELAQIADVHLDVSVEREACPHDLAPTTSTTAALAMGDALAVAVLQSRGFSAEDFARTHPGGALGKRLLLYVSDIMHTGSDIPLVDKSASLADALVEMTGKSLGMTGVVNSKNQLLGIFTDGDLRRALDQPVDANQVNIQDLMTPDPFSVRPDTLAASVVNTMREHAQSGQHAINAVFITDANNQVLGALNTHDLLRAGVV